MADTGLSITGTLGVSGATTLSSTLGVTGLSTLTGGFSSGANSSVTGTFGVSGATTLSSTLGVSGLTTAALIKTTGVYGASSPLTLYATDGTTPRVQVADGGPIVLTDTGTDSYLRYAATGNSSGQRQWRAGNVLGDFRVDGGDDAASTWGTLFRGTQSTGVPNALYWGGLVRDVNPGAPYYTNLGNVIDKYLSASIAQLNVSTLVAREEVADINGRFLIGSGATEVTEAVAAADTTITVKHNSLDNGDRIHMEGGGKVEFMAVTSGPTDLGTAGTSSIAYVDSDAGTGTSVTLPTHSTGDLLVGTMFRDGSTTPPSVGLTTSSVVLLGSTSTTGNATSVTLPAHSTGDTIVIIAWRHDSNTSVALPSGWTNICNGTGSSQSYRVGYKIAASSGEVSDTWTSARHLHAFVFSGVTGFGACDTLHGNGVTTLSYPALTLTATDGSSRVLRAGMVTADVSVPAPSGAYTIQTTTISGSSTTSSVFASDAGVTSVTQSDHTITSGKMRGISVEILGTLVGGGGDDGDWTTLASGGSDSTAYRVVWKIAGGSETPGDWTNVTSWHVSAYSGATGVGAVATAADAASSTLTYPVLTLDESDTSSWVLSAGYSSADTTVDANAPASATLRSTATGSGEESASFDSAGGTGTNPTSTPVSLSSSGHVRGIRVELLGTLVGGASGPYEYDVTRDLDGTGADDWDAGDGVFNTGQTGDGWWDIYAINSVRGGAELGPTMCANQRTGSTYNAWASRFCAGNLYGTYGNGAADLFGVAFGDYTDVWGQIDPTNGVRFFEGGTNQKLRIDPTGYVLIGQSGSGEYNAYIDNAQWLLRVGTTDLLAASTSSGHPLVTVGRTTTSGDAYAQMTAGTFRIGRVGDATYRAVIDSTGIALTDGTTTRVSLGTTVSAFGGTTGARVQYTYSTGRFEAFDGSNNRQLWWDATNGLVLGPGTNASDKPYMHLTGTTLAFCQESGSCPLQLDGANGNMTADGSIAIGTSGHIRGGASSYSSGTGFFLGYDSSAYKFRIGDPSGQKLQWDGSQLMVVAQQVQLGNTIINSGSITNPTTGNLVIGATNTGAKLTLGSFYGNEIILDSFVMRTNSDASTELGSSSYRFSNIHLALSSEANPTHVVVLDPATPSQLKYTAGWTGTCSAASFTVKGGIITSC